MSQMPPTPSYQAPPPAGKPQGMAIASMVLGIVAIVLFCIWWISIPCAILAIILGFIANGKIARGEAGGGGMAKTGIILGIVSTILAVLLVILALVGVSMFGSKMQELQKQMEQQQRQQQTQPANP